MHVNDLLDDGQYWVLIDLNERSSWWSSGKEIKRFWKRGNVAKIQHGTSIPVGYSMVQCDDDVFIAAKSFNRTPPIESTFQAKFLNDKMSGSKESLGFVYVAKPGTAPKKKRKAKVEVVDDQSNSPDIGGPDMPSPTITPDTDVLLLSVFQTAASALTMAISSDDDCDEPQGCQDTQLPAEESRCDTLPSEATPEALVEPSLEQLSSSETTDDVQPPVQ